MEKYSIPEKDLRRFPQYYKFELRKDGEWCKSSHVERLQKDNDRKDDLIKRCFDHITNYGGPHANSTLSPQRKIKEKLLEDLSDEIDIKLTRKIIARNTKWEQFEEKVDCDACLHSIEHEDEDKWDEPVACGKCGRSKNELIELEKKYWEIKKCWKNK